VTDVGERGPVETAVRRDVALLAAQNVGLQRSLAEMTYALAGQLDEVRWLGTASAGLAAAAVAKELRATLDALVGVGDDSDRTAEILAQLAAPVSSAVGDAAQP
jgi:hypothetical protein